MHSEWSWDTTTGDMEQSCARAVEIGLPAVAFTEHLDHTVWRVALDGPYHDARQKARETLNRDEIIRDPSLSMDEATR